MLRDIESGAIELVSLDSREPSPFAHQLLNANPYAFLDDAPLEERRARAVTMRRTLSAEALSDLGRLDPEAIALVKSEAWPLVRDADELHDVLLSLGALPIERRRVPGKGSSPNCARRAGPRRFIGTAGPPLWVATERWPLMEAIWPDCQARPEVDGACRRSPRLAARRGDRCIWFVAAWNASDRPPRPQLAHELGLNPSEVGRGPASPWKMKESCCAANSRRAAQIGNDSATASSRDRLTPSLEWCDRRLLARIHRLTLEGLRRQIAPVPFEQFVRFLIRHQHAHPQTMLRGQTGLLSLIEQLEGFEAPAGHWEKYLLPARIDSYSPGWLDGLTFFGQAAWGRLRPVLPVARRQGPGQGCVDSLARRRRSASSAAAGRSRR